MPKDKNVTVLPQAMNAFSFNRVILQGPHGTIMHKTVHEDLRYLDFVSTQSFICYLIKGRERFTDTEGAEVTLTAGDLIAVPKDVRLQSDFVSSNGPLEAILIFCSDQLLRELVRCRPMPVPGTSPQAERIAAHKSLTAFMGNLVEIYETLSADSELVHAKLLELLLLLDTLHEAGDLLAALHAPPPTSSRNIHEIARIYEDHDLSNSELAALSGRSIASFQRDFRSAFGTSPAQWRIKRRLEKACDLLEKTDRNVTQIALESGYDSPSYFIEQFRKHLGKTPGQFRKESADPQSPALEC